MPTYGYRCKDCEREFEVWQRMTDPPLAACPTCGGSGKRLFFPAGLVFKGAGFYVTDNRRGAAGANGSSGSSGFSEGDTASSKKSSKPDSGPAAAKPSGTAASTSSE